MLNNHFLKTRNNPLQLKKDRKERIKGEIEKPIKKNEYSISQLSCIVSKDDLDKFKKQEMKKIKQSVTANKLKIIKHELKDKKLMIFGNFLKQKKKKKKEKNEA